MMTYSQAKMLLLRGRNGRKKVGNNTWLQWNDFAYQCDIDVILHNTAVVCIFENGTYRLNSGGFRTYTTKDRINTFSPAKVFQHSRVWYVHGTDGNWLFRDGMTVDSQGWPVYPAPRWRLVHTSDCHNVTTDTDSDSRGPA